MNSKKNVDYWLINLQEMLIMQHGNVKSLFSKEQCYKGEIFVNLTESWKNSLDRFRFVCGIIL